MEACRRHIRDSLMPDFEQHVRESLPEPSKWRIEPDPDDPDEQTVLFHYPAAAAGSDYIRAVVKIELGARSDIDPSAEPNITPYVAEVFPAEIGNSTFSVRTVAPERTFWQKVALLHEEEHRTTDDPPKARLARHYYDIWSLIQAGIGERAMADTGLFERVAAHRVIFFRKNREAQASLRAGSLRVIPSVRRRSAWKQDYEVMRESMFFGETPSFDDILAVVADFEQRFCNWLGRTLAAS